MRNATTSRLRNKLALFVLFTALVAFTVTVPAASASAAPAGDFAQLQAALDAGEDVELTSDIAASAQTLDVRESVTLDLNGFHLETDATTLATGVTLTVEDTVGAGGWTSVSTDSATAGIGNTSATLVINSGTITATGGDASAGIGGGYLASGGTTIINGGTITATGGTYGAGIGGGVGATGTVTISGGTVTAIGGTQGAGIGGGSGGSGGTITIDGGTVTATGGTDSAGIGGGSHGHGGTITISGGTISATGGTHGAGIGGGDSGSGGTTTINGGTVTATAGSGISVIGPGEGTVGFGSLSVGGTLEIPAGAFLGIPTGESATVTNTGVITGDGALKGGGAIQNGGIITNTDVADAADGGPGLTISNHNYLLGFDGNYSGASAIDPVRVYATSFDAGLRTLPAPTRASFSFGGWNTAVDGSGAPVTELTTLSAGTTLYAQWVPTLAATGADPAPPLLAAILLLLLGAGVLLSRRLSSV